MLPHHIPKKKISLFLGDIFFVFLACVISPSMRFGTWIFEPAKAYEYCFTVTVVFTFFLYVFDLYNLDIISGNTRSLSRLSVGICIGAIACVVFFFLFPRLDATRGIFVINVALVAVGVFVWRFLFRYVAKGIVNKKRNVLIVGAGRAGRAVHSSLKGDPTLHVIGFVDVDHHKEIGHKSPPILGNDHVIEGLTADGDLHEIVVAINRIRNPDLFGQLMQCKMKGIEVQDLPAFYEKFLGKVQVEYLTDSWFLDVPISGVRSSIYNKRIKRVIGMTLSGFFLLVGLPFILITILAIKVDSRGSAFYKQRRVGLNGDDFDLVKFRSMRTDAEKNGAVWAAKEDSRVTRVGRIIRKLRVDEVPQMWNVLKGDMNFFGPRPERPEFVNILKEKIPYYDLRHAVKPGITGWAQVNYPYGASEEDALEKLKYDLFYIKNVSPFLDFHIFMRTIRVVLFGKGAR